MAQVAVADFGSVQDDSSSLDVTGITVNAGEAIIGVATIGDTAGDKEVSTVTLDPDGTPQGFGSIVFNQVLGNATKRIVVFRLISPNAVTNVPVRFQMEASNKVGAFVWVVTNPHQTTLLSGLQFDDNGSGTAFAVNVPQAADDLALLIGVNSSKDVMSPDNSEVEHEDFEVAGDFQAGAWSLDGGPALGCSGFSDGQNGCIGFLVNAAPTVASFPPVPHHTKRSPLWRM